MARTSFLANPSFVGVLNLLAVGVVVLPLGGCIMPGPEDEGNGEISTDVLGGVEGSLGGADVALPDGSAEGGAGSSDSSNTEAAADSTSSEGGFNADGSPKNRVSLSEECKLIYVVDDMGTLHSFNPTSKAFSRVGTISCEGMASPFSMAVSRNGTAYVEDMTGMLYNVNLRDGSCRSLPYEKGQHDFWMFGMSFAVDESNESGESLFVAESSIGQLGRINPATMELQAIGGHLPMGELAGTPEGELWGFFSEASPVRVSRLNKQTGEELESFALPTLSSGMVSLAMANWQGDFYAFYYPSTEASTQVYKVKTDGSMELYVPNTGLNIVGSGVAACQPGE